ncbi:MAG: EutN/CcmL family microcompartment protein [Bryobacteraceae bacterium]|nr:EutN/CcmL family microcompartment protein [Bryobacteraceae bacterium]
MQLGRVIGRVWSTVKDASLQNQRLLLVQPCNASGAASGRPIVCTDATGSAGAGELIYWCRGREASFAFAPLEVVADNTVVGIVDELHVPPRDAEE